jgi:hypothetical protein
MLPLLSLHAIAAQRGDGLHPKLLAGLKRLAAASTDRTARESGGERANEPTADRVSCEDAVPPKRAA